MADEYEEEIDLVADGGGQGRSGAGGVFSPAAHAMVAQMGFPSAAVNQAARSAQHMLNGGLQAVVARHAGGKPQDKTADGKNRMDIPGGRNGASQHERGKNMAATVMAVATSMAASRSASAASSGPSTLEKHIAAQKDRITEGRTNAEVMGDDESKAEYKAIRTAALAEIELSECQA
jgi:hypothetical protein